jgi:hypothetical protein
MANPGQVCFPSVMSESQFIRHPPSAAPPLPPSHLNQSGLEIQWREDAGIVIKIQLCRLTADPVGHPAKPAGSSRYFAPTTSATGQQKLPPSSAGRWIV